MPEQRLAGRWQEPRQITCQDGTTVELPRAPRIVAYFRCSAYVLAGSIEFLIDTGADITTIMPDDRANIVIPSYALVSGCPEVMIGVGGGVPIKYLENVALEFQDEEGEVLPAIALNRIGVLNPPARQAGAYRGTPSLLGRDFLSRCRVDLTTDSILLCYRD